MEEVIKFIPTHVSAQLHGATSAAELAEACANLEKALLLLPRYHELLSQLLDPNGPTAKAPSAAEAGRATGNEHFKAARYEKAIISYTEALRYAPMGTQTEKGIAARIHANRAACFQHQGEWEAAYRDCSAAIDLDPKYSKAWYRRGTVLAARKMRAAAQKDFSTALHLEQTSSPPLPANTTAVSDIMIQLSKLESSLGSGTDRPEPASWPPRHLSSSETSGGNESPRYRSEAVGVQYAVGRGRGVVAARDVKNGEVVMTEQAPFAALLLKPFRSLRCHFCFHPLPLGPLPCQGCSAALYCSPPCREEGGGEHTHECGGASWAAALPVNAVLAARVVMRQLAETWSRREGEGEAGDGEEEGEGEGEREGGWGWSWAEGLKVESLVTHIEAVPPCDRPSFFALAAVIASCLQKRGPAGGLCAWSVAETMGRLRMNAMAVAVAQALYPSASLLNHSCRPTAAVSFQGRQLSVRATGSTPGGTPIDISYSVQQGEMSTSQRQKVLLDKYRFRCSCRVCTHPPPSEAYLQAYVCPRGGCGGPTPELEAGGGGWGEGDGGGERRVGEGTCVDCGCVWEMTSAVSRARYLEGQVMRNGEKGREGLGQRPDGASSALATSALERQVAALEGLRSVLHGRNQRIGRSEDCLAECHVSIGDFAGALRHCRNSLKIVEFHYPSESISLALERLKFAALLATHGDTAQARTFREQAYPIVEAHYGPRI